MPPTTFLCKYSSVFFCCILPCFLKVQTNTNSSARNYPATYQMFDMSNTSRMAFVDFLTRNDC